jgi:HEAT repeat protein
VREQARAAVRAMGTNAVPALLLMLEAKESFLDKRFMELNEKQSIVEFPVRPAERDRVRAAEGLAWLGPAAKPAVPALSNALHDPDTFRPAVYALAHIGAEAKMPLSMALTNDDWLLRKHALNCLGVPGAHRDTALPLILSTRTNADPPTRALATRCLAVGGTNAIPLLMDALGDRATSVRVAAIGALAGLRSNATTAVPALLHVYSNDEVSVRFKAGQALKLIDPQAAERAGIKEPTAPPRAWRNPGGSR